MSHYIRVVPSSAPMGDRRIRQHTYNKKKSNNTTWTENGERKCKYYIFILKFTHFRRMYLDEIKRKKNRRRRTTQNAESVRTLIHKIIFHTPAYAHLPTYISISFAPQKHLWIYKKKHVEAMWVSHPPTDTLILRFHIARRPSYRRISMHTHGL